MIQAKYYCALFFIYSLVSSATLLAQSRASLVEIDEVTFTNSIQTTRIVGRVISNQQGNIAAKTSGTLSQILVQLGDSVKSGQILARLDTALLATNHALAKAELDSAGAALRTVRAQMDLAKQETSRLRKLQNSVAASKAQFDDAVQNEHIQSIRVEESIIAQQQKQIELKIAKLRLGYAAIKAPYDGIITRRFKEIGDYAQQGEPLFSMLNDQFLEIDANIFSTLADTLDKNTEITGTTYSGSQFKAKLRTIIALEDDRTRTLQARFSVTQAPSEPLISGRSVTLDLPSGPAESYISVHKDAIVYKAGKTVVFQVIEDLAHQKDVQLGTSDGNRFEVISGLSAGDIVIIRGNERMRDQQQVSIKQDQN